jgi:hypothetical protein
MSCCRRRSCSGTGGAGIDALPSRLDGAGAGRGDTGRRWRLAAPGRTGESDGARGGGAGRVGRRPAREARRARGEATDRPRTARNTTARRHPPPREPSEERPHRGGNVTEGRGSGRAPALEVEPPRCGCCRKKVDAQLEVAPGKPVQGEHRRSPPAHAVRFQVSNAGMMWNPGSAPSRTGSRSPSWSGARRSQGPGRARRRPRPAPELGDDPGPQEGPVRLAEHRHVGAQADLRPRGEPAHAHRDRRRDHRLEVPGDAALAVLVRLTVAHERPDLARSLSLASGAEANTAGSR